MRQILTRLSLQTHGEGFTDLTARLDAEIGRSGLAQGIAVLAVQHTSCSLTVNENADPRVLADLAAYLRALVPQQGVRPISGQGQRGEGQAQKGAELQGAGQAATGRQVRRGHGPAAEDPTLSALDSPASRGRWLAHPGCHR